jgi:predicted permease
VIRGQVSYPQFQRIRDRNAVFSGIFGAYTLRDIEVSADGRPLGRTSAELVSGNYFSLLGVGTVLGRPLTPDDDRTPESSPVAVISDRLWERAFARSPDVLGRAVRVGQGAVGHFSSSGFEQDPGKPRQRETTLTIVGVAPREFFGDTVGTAVDLWTPMMMQPALMPGRPWLTRTTASWVSIMGRLRPGVTEARARAALTTLSRVIRAEEIGPSISEQQKQNIAKSTVNVETGEKGFAQLRREFSQPLLILTSVVALVLLIACLNIANLLLARATARQHEISMRLSLGASRTRIVRQLLTESVVLAGAGGVLGLLIARVGTDVLVSMVSNDRRPIDLGFATDGRIIGFTTGVALLSGVLFGLAPALRGSAAGLQVALKDVARTTGGGRSRTAKVLVAGQIAISLMLLVGAGLFLRTLYNLKTQEVGYDRAGLVMLRLDPVAAGYRGDDIGRSMVELMHRLAMLPGVRSVTLSENGLFGGPESGSNIEVEGFKPASNDDRNNRFDQVGPHYFTNVGIPLLLGRDILESDRPGAPRVAVINDTMARFYFPAQNPIGKHLYMKNPPNDFTIEIVGVARDAQDHSFRRPPERRFYVPYLQPVDGVIAVNFEIRTAAGSAAVFAPVRDEVQRFNRGLQVLNLKYVDTLMDESIASERLVAKLSAFFGALAVLLAAIGLYGVMSYTVARRTNEIGIRMALGAHRWNVIRMIIGEIALLIIAGTAVGAVAAFGLTQYVSNLIFGLTPNDPLTFVGAAVLLMTVGLVAGYLPARRASRISPLTALRYE